MKINHSETLDFAFLVYVSWPTKIYTWKWWFAFQLQLVAACPSWSHSLRDAAFLCIFWYTECL